MERETQNGGRKQHKKMAIGRKWEVANRNALASNMNPK
jgi:hypothetical protein